jgi:hypothetical protein
MRFAELVKYKSKSLVRNDVRVGHYPIKNQRITIPIDC